MKINRVWVLVGGVFLIIGAVLPWLTKTICMMPPPGPFCVTRYISGMDSFAPLCPASSGSFTAAGGVILVLIALYEDRRASRVYSTIAIIVSLLCLFPVAGAVFFAPVVSEETYLRLPD